MFLQNESTRATTNTSRLESEQFLQIFKYLFDEECSLHTKNELFSLQWSISLIGANFCFESVS